MWNRNYSKTNWFTCLVFSKLLWIWPKFFQSNLKKIVDLWRRQYEKTKFRTAVDDARISKIHSTAVRAETFLWIWKRKETKHFVRWANTSNCNRIISIAFRIFIHRFSGNFSIIFTPMKWIKMHVNHNLYQLKIGNPSLFSIYHHRKNVVADFCQPVNLGRKAASFG